MQINAGTFPLLTHALKKNKLGKGMGNGQVRTMLENPQQSPP